MNGRADRPLLASGRWTVEAAAQRQNKPKKGQNSFSERQAGASRQPDCVRPINAAKIVYQNGDNYRFDDSATPVYFKYSNVDQQMSYDKREPPNEGPFVFGVHSPSQFPIRSRFAGEDAYDDNKSVIDNNTSELNSLCCDKKVNVKQPANANRDVFCVKGGRRRTKDKSTRDRKNIKCVLVGDGAVGKTSLITSYAQNLFQYDYKPTTFDKYNVEVEVDEKPISVQICDTSGQDYLEGVNELCYPESDVIILCFSIVKPESFRSIQNRWLPGVSKVKAPYVLVGTQCDLKDHYGIINDLKLQGEHPVSESEARTLASTINAPYIETSSKTRYKLKDAFDAAILAALPYEKKRPMWKKLLCIS